ncbi:hypothetical protein HanRHA438_Chr01g0041011 [Helianthus annuus]|uniref:Uncharacterized protein n=1 Tax=Helianthus annuus TaxID=4232 RepID=A0A9K3JXS2_HELAN|nr:hypothetical protein HanXRQr2_Chr01g0040131 [Helianthus annuus]KAJ0624572.1 hypothetical protein HanIR_Chr01g0044531 [Helianthus annuus]KAJ0949656.1 hypothetical protein HanRHA438_Chr01g0041011 [Helianthus annuus]
MPLLPINNSTPRKFLVLKTIFVMVLDTSLSLFRPLEMRLNELTMKKEQDQHLYLPTWCNEVTSEIEGHPRRRWAVIDVSHVLLSFLTMKQI